MRLSWHVNICALLLSAMIYHAIVTAAQRRISSLREMTNVLAGCQRAFLAEPLLPNKFISLKVAIADTNMLVDTLIQELVTAVDMRTCG